MKKQPSLPLERERKLCRGKRPRMMDDLIKFAEEDIRSAEILFGEEIYNQACFHSQQCVEKLLKACLLSHGKHFPKIHSLDELAEECIKAGELSLLQYKSSIAILTLYYTVTRYPDALIGSLPDRLPNESDAKEAIDTAKSIYDLLVKKIDMKGRRRS